MAVVKSNAYGHGLVHFSKHLEAFGVDWFGVDSVVEAVRLRSSGIQKPILVLGYTLPINYRRVAKYRVRLTISTLEGLTRAKRAGVKFHLKIDTGMHRQGFLLTELPKVIRELKRLKIKPKQFEGLYTHLAAPAHPTYTSQTRRQVENFKKGVALIEAAGYRPLRHAAATNGALLHPDAHFDMVRIGMGLYGFLPSTGLRSFRKLAEGVRPALSWKTRIAEVKRVSKGESVGYDFTKRLSQATTLAICPVGYWHGYPRILSNSGSVLVMGKRAPILGRISMDMLTIDVTRIPKARVGTEVVLIGRSGKDEIPVEELATRAGTSGYEIITRLNPLIQKIYQ
jgi:alanine racemase